MGDSGMTIRALSLPKDLLPLENMLVRTFQYPENPEWSIQADEEDGIVEIEHYPDLLKKYNAPAPGACE